MAKCKARFSKIKYVVLELVFQTLLVLKIVFPKTTFSIKTSFSTKNHSTHCSSAGAAGPGTAACGGCRAPCRAAAGATAAAGSCLRHSSAQTLASGAGPCAGC